MPSVTEAADEALVGRTTAYRYFPTQDHLVLEAALGDVVETLEATEGTAIADSDDASERVRMTLDMLHGRIADNEEAFRTIIRMSLEKASNASHGEEVEIRLLGGRRMSWMERALEPMKDTLTPEKFRDLSAALAMLAGTEPFIALKDACQIDDIEDRRRIIQWMADTLLGAVLDENA